MKTILAIIGALALIVVILFAALFAIGFQKAGPLLEEAHEYADDSIPAIATDWNGQELLDRAAPELRALLRDGALEMLMGEGERQLGAMTSNDPAACQITNFLLNTEVGELVEAQCVAVAYHQRAKAQYVLNLVKRHNEWKILGFFVTPGERQDGPVMVDFQPSDGKLPGAFTVSIRNQSIGLRVASSPANIGANVDKSKIENF